MEKIIEYTALKDNYILVDVRSPGEFKESCIPGAVNIPIFTDEERAIVGTTYKQESVEKAKELGIQFVSNKLLDLFRQFSELKSKYKMIVVYCARGGMRSGSVCSLFGSLGMNVWQLRGGYKGYRQLVNDELPKLNEHVKYIVIHGNTGVGKTKLLHRLEELGLEVLDLEKAANHRGSLLGSVGLPEKRSQKQFEALVYEKLRNRKSDYIFVECESRRIGSIIMPEYIPDSMAAGTHILIEASLDTRALNIVEDYITDESSKKDLIECLNKLRRYMSNESIDSFIQLVNNNEYIKVAKILMEQYYDPLYEHSQLKYSYDLTVKADDIESACDQICEWFNNINNDQGEKQ